MDGGYQSCWIPASAAFKALRQQYEEHHLYGDEEHCWKAAHDTLLRRLQSGQLAGRAAQVLFEWDDGSEPSEPLCPDRNGRVLVPSRFWTYFLQSKSIHREADWLPGDFSFTLSYSSGFGRLDATCKGTVIGLEVDENDLPKLAWTGNKEASGRGSMQSAVARSGGRSPAKWWPDFAEELALYVHECGIPDGQGHDGQSEMMEAIFKRLAEAGKPEPGRATVQSVINAVMARIRSAGN
ncbi:hypothetical protein [Blastomonas sp. AAP25]|uniref:hypothetical protein n=1 Tax=Blastomonas sp. AAP25 TaxID=1523416 RepID=UPI000AF0D2D7|nr:hypothetical protein [Blastomonas sp. AAP25]